MRRWAHGDAFDQPKPTVSASFAAEVPSPFLTTQLFPIEPYHDGFTPINWSIADIRPIHPIDHGTPSVRHCQAFVTQMSDWDERGSFTVNEVEEMVTHLLLKGVPIKEKAKKSEKNDEIKMVDEVLLDAVVVLRIHLAELHRLSELCEKFVANYRERISRTFAQQRELLTEETEQKIGQFEDNGRVKKCEGKSGGWKGGRDRETNRRI